MIDIVVGGQFGSEGKGKVAYHFAKLSNHKTVIRVGGPNSGHTANNIILKQLPVASLIPEGISILAAGSYINLDILFSEIDRIKPNKLYIDENAFIITSKESDLLKNKIGSTLSGTGKALSDRINRLDYTTVKDIADLKNYLVNKYDLIELVKNGAILEGTQGSGLSVLHSPYYPYVTARDTNAAGLLSETGLSPLLVRKIILVIRTYPIRVSGNSGPLPTEASWKDLGLQPEYTSVTKKIRRVGYFDPEIVKLAILINNPTEIVLNHVDYIPLMYQDLYIKYIESLIKYKISYIGLGKNNLSKL